MSRATVILDPIHLVAIRLGAASAVALGMPCPVSASRSQHDLWTSALLLHGVAQNPLWRVGASRPAAAVDTVMQAALRLTERAVVMLSQPVVDLEAA